MFLLCLCNLTTTRGRLTPERHFDGHRHRQMDRQTDRLTDRETDVKTDVLERQTHEQIERLMKRNRDWRDRHTYKEKYRQRDEEIE